MEHLTPSQIQKINKTALAKEHETSQSYVSEVLYGIKPKNTDKAKAIYAHAVRVVKALETKPKVEAHV